MRCLGETPAVAVFQTNVPATGAPPPFGFTTGAETLTADKATLGGTRPFVDEDTSKAPSGVVVPTPT